MEFLNWTKNFIWYLLRNVIKIFFLVASIALLLNFNVGMSGDIGLTVFLFFMFFVNVSTTYDLGGGWFLKITTGVGLGGAFVGTFLVMILSTAIMTWIEAHTTVVIGILLASFVINQIIETIKYFDVLPMFFTVTGAFCALVYAIEMFCVFFQNSLFASIIEGDNLGDFLILLLLGLTVILTLVNIIARATQADCVED